MNKKQEQIITEALKEFAKLCKEEKADYLNYLRKRVNEGKQAHESALREKVG